MSIAAPLSGWTSEQKHVVAASFLVPESPTWRPTTTRSNTLVVLRSHWQLGICAVLPMTAFNFFSHGTQDLYPTFLQVQHKMTPHEVGLIAVIYNIGAIIGSISFGSLSERFGRLAGIAVHYGNDYAFALALVTGIVVVIVILTALGVEAKGAAFGTSHAPGPGHAVSPAL
jgi:MFS family permease